jgi:hypothetical protein
MCDKVGLPRVEARVMLGQKQEMEIRKNGLRECISVRIYAILLMCQKRVSPRVI